MINKATVKHVAHLARLDLTNQEVNQYANELTSIVGYINQLKEVETEMVEPTAQITGLINQTRPDQAEPWPLSEIKQALEQAGVKPGEMIKVPKIL